MNNGKPETTPENSAGKIPLKRVVSCDFCKEDGKNIFDFETLDYWVLGWCDAPITKENASYSNNAVFIDRGYLRMTDVDDSQCMDHGDKVRIKFCPFCGKGLDN